jgi:hypothetical protein
MPIYVQVPGGKMDTAGRGAAAAQGFRLNEREADRRDMAFETEREVALRKVQLDEETVDFQKEQLAEQQGAAADVLMGMALQGGAKFGTPQEQQAFHAALKNTSPRFQGQMAETLGRGVRLRQEQERTNQIIADLELTPDTAALVQSGQLTEPAAIERAMAKERQKIALTADQEQARLGALEAYTASQGEPGFDMPEIDTEAHRDVMEILGMLHEGASTNLKTNYRKLTKMLAILTNRDHREAAWAIMENDLGGTSPDGLPRDARIDAMTDEGFMPAQPDSAPSRGKLMGKGGAGGGKPPMQLPKVVPGEESGTQSEPAGATGLSPKGATAPKSVAEVSAGAVTGKVPDDKAALARKALSNLGMKTVPPKGTTERAKLAAEILRLQKEAVGDAENDSVHQMMQELR